MRHLDLLSDWGRVTHICVGNLIIIGSDNVLSPGRRQAMSWTNVGILLIRPIRTNYSKMLIEIHTFSFKKIHLKMSSGNWRPFCLGLNVFIRPLHVTLSTLANILLKCVIIRSYVLHLFMAMQRSRLHQRLWILLRFQCRWNYSG